MTNKTAGFSTSAFVLKDAEVAIRRVVKEYGNACPNDTDGDGDCWMCVHDSGIHWRRVLTVVSHTL